METIKSYLEAMFANMPNTAEVRKAKSELLQMMEDKYNELIEEGKSENAAVGTVISEFGNLDDLADDLGLTEEVNEVKDVSADNPRIQVTLEEAKEFISNTGKKGFFLGLGVMLCIISIACPIMFGSSGYGEIGASLMFVSIALGVGAIVYSSFVGAEWKFIKNQLCQIDMNTAAYVKDHRKIFEATRAICITVGVILCIICWVPTIIFGKYGHGAMGAAMIFILVGLGVFLIVYSNTACEAYDALLKLNDSNTISGKYNDVIPPDAKFKSKKAETIVAVYWPTVTCLYLIISFLTFQWGVTWIIWPIAAVAHRAVVINCLEDEE